MVVKPNQKTELSVEESGQIRGLETQIDIVLVQGMKNRNSYMCYRPPKETTHRVIEHIQEMYQSAGWTVGYESDQQEGNFLRFTYKN